MKTNYRFILIGCMGSDPWYKVMERATSTLGTLHYLSKEEALDFNWQLCYEIIIIDAAIAPDFSALISTIKYKLPKPKVLVATASPTWELAREAYRAGAVDYIRKSLQEEEMRLELQAILNNQVRWNDCEPVLD